MTTFETFEKRTAARERWRALSPYHRYLLMAERPDEFEREERLRSETVLDLESAFGPRQWDATVAVIAEGEAEEGDYAGFEPEAMTLAEIGQEFSLSRERVRRLIQEALAKMGCHPIIRELHLGFPPPLATDEEINWAIRSARKNGAW